MAKNNNKKNRLEDEIKRISKLARYTKPDKKEGALKLDSNENFAIEKEFIANLTAEAARQVDMREYPLDQLEQMYIQLARYISVSEKCVAAGSGSDQVIELLLSTLRSKRATVFTPTFSYFINRCDLHNIKVDTVPLESDFELDSKLFVKSAKKSDIIYICSPNNPTGNQLHKETIIDIINSLGDKLILIDEAYADFADYSLSHEATKRSNVIVLRTLSKAFGLAGARIGYMVANEKFVKVFRSTIQSPYPISTLSLAIASGILEHIEHVKKIIAMIRKERERIADRLTKIEGLKTFKSDSNFIFIEAGSRYQAVSKVLAKNDIIVKMLGNNIAGHRGCMRVTIGTREMNDKFLECMEEGMP